MSGKKSRKEMYKEIYKVTYVANISKMIDETRYIDVLQKLCMNGFKTYHIRDFDKLTVYLQNIGLTDSFNMSVLIHLRDTNYKRLSEIAVFFEDIGAIFSNKKISMVSRVSAIRKILREKLTITRSFKKIEKLSNFLRCNRMNTIGNLDFDIKINNIDELLRENNTGNDTTNTDNTFRVDYIDRANKRSPFEKMNTKCFYSKKRMTKSRIESEWRFHTRNDILNRLHLLAQTHFTLNQLTFMGVELKHILEIESMSHNALESYYITTINTVLDSLKDWMMLCRMYIDIEVNYIECCDNVINGMTTKLNLKHFKVDIRNSYYD
jgi:hypothetical protein